MSDRLNTSTLMGINPVIPVVVLHDAALAVPLARALLAGGVRILELTLRSQAALAAIEAIAEAVPEMIIGAGTVVRQEQVAQALSAGAQFLVSPGSPSPLIDTMLASGVPILPGAATVTEAMALADRGLTELKFFPAAAAGGPEFLKSLSGPLPDLQFCPTGGITSATAESYLKLASVPCVGGSWLTPIDRLVAQDWAGITTLAAATRTN